MNTAEVGQRLCDLCREGKNLQAIDELYADDIVSIEAVEGNGMPRVMEGKQQVRGKTEWWENAHEINGATVDGPLLHGDDWFAVVFGMDATAKESGERFQMKEVAVYQVDGGRITREEFFYAP